MGNSRRYTTNFIKTHTALGMVIKDGILIKPKRKAKTIVNEKEHSIQKEIIQYCRLSHILAFQTDIMDGLKFFSQKDPRRFNFISHHKAMGYIKGQPDLVVCLQNKVIFVELKTSTGKQSKEQKEFQSICKAMNIDYYVIRSLDEFKAITLILKNKFI